jgi:RimJ/RimL family protein N-acetyltransferase
MRIETDRLLIRSFERADVPAYAEIVADPRVTRWIGDGEPLSFAQAEANVEDLIALDRTTGISRYAVELDGELIGFCGFRDLGDHIDFGWRYAHRHWGRGYATEAARAVLAHGIDELKLTRIVAVAYEANVGSVRVIEKLGFEHVETLDDPRGPIVKYVEPRRRAAS